MAAQKKLIISLVALVAVIALAYFGYSQVSSQAKEERATNVAEDVKAFPEIKVNDGKSAEKVSITSMRGKPTLVGFWATWCTYCEEEAEAIQRLYDEYGDHVNFMQVDYTDGTQDTVESATEWVTSRGYTYPVYFDTDLSAATALGVTGLPTTFLVDADGNTVVTFTSAVSYQTVATQIDKLLAQ